MAGFREHNGEYFGLIKQGIAGDNSVWNIQQ